jgi:glycosyltransferase involved in cell wall biosynthesis
MKICILSSAHPPFDKRVFDKEATALAAAGFIVTHLAPDQQETQKMIKGVAIKTYIKSPGIIGRLFQIPRLYKLALDINADCYHCNEVDSWLVGVLLKLTHQKKVIFDVHEHYPSTFAESRFPEWIQPLVANIVRIVFKLLLPFTDRVVFAKRSVASDFSGSEAKQVLVQNFTPLAADNIESSVEQNSVNNEIRAIHLGLMSRERGWPQLLAAMEMCKSTNFMVQMVGTFNDGSRSDFDAKVRELGLENRIKVEEWMPFEEAYQRIRTAQIGLVLFQPGIQNHVYALPHKMFDYMLAKLAIVTPAFAEEVSSIVTEADCGIQVDPANPAEIARALDRLVTDASERQRLGENGRRAVLQKYNWETEAATLIEMYENI